ncbi:MAG: hypothetical protein HZB76_01395 [Chlamydiae bacterium]|nr:hypothetical protein [Chlamydiota bacterium]
MTFSLFAEEPLQIASKNGSFDGSLFSLSNNIQIEHKFGKISAQEAFIEDADKNSFRLNLKGRVTLNLKSGAVLKSDTASFDSASSKISFLDLKDKVTYEDTIISKHTQKNKLFLSAHNLECLFANFKSFDKASLNDLVSLTFFDDVHFIFDDQFHCYSEKAICQKDELGAFKILLYPLKDKIHFQFEQNKIDATFAKVDLKNNDFVLTKPSGELSLFDYKNISFSSDEIKWQNFNQSLSLSGNVILDYKNNGSIKSDEIIIIKHPYQKSISKILTKGKTDLSMFKTSKVASRLSCNGTIELDNDKGTILCLSNKNLNDELIFQDDQLTVSSKKAFLNYSKDQKLQNVLLEDNVRFVYRKKDNTLGFGIADIISYNPISKELTLKSLPEKKVLFWQDDDSVHLSAKEIEVNRRNKDSIKGVGDVRFAFNLEEEKLIKDIFTRYLRD